MLGAGREGALPRTSGARTGMRACGVVHVPDYAVRERVELPRGFPQAGFEAAAAAIFRLASPWSAVGRHPVSGIYLAAGTFRATHRCQESNLG